MRRAESPARNQSGSARQSPPGRPAPRRTGLVLATIVTALIVVGVLVAISATGGDREGGAPAGSALAGVAAVRAELAGVQSSGARLGPADAPIRIVEYADLQCPFCARAAEGLMPELIDRWVRPGRASLTFRALTFVGPDSRRGALAVLAAARQNRLWPLAALLYRNQGAESSGWLSESIIDRAADAAGGIDRGRLRADMASPETEAALERDAAAGEADGVRSTPFFVVSGPGGRRLVGGAQELSSIEAAIREVSP